MELRISLGILNIKGFAHQTPMMLIVQPIRRSLGQIAALTTLTTHLALSTENGNFRDSSGLWSMRSLSQPTGFVRRFVGSKAGFLTCARGLWPACADLGSGVFDTSAGIG